MRIRINTQKQFGRCFLVFECLFFLCAPSCSTSADKVEALNTSTNDDQQVKSATLHVSKASSSKLSRYVGLTCEMPSQSLSFDEDLNVNIQVQPSPTFYLYESVQEGGAFHPLTFSLELADGSTVDAHCSFVTQSRELNGALVFDQPITATLSFPFKMISKSDHFTLHMDYQACNDLMCLPLSRLSVTLRYETKEH
jgi:hypothetical protein